MPRILRKRCDESAGHRWVDENYDVKKEILDKSGGIMPSIPAFTTAPFEVSDNWSEDNPPAILFYLEPPPTEFDRVRVQPLRDEDGKVVPSPYQNTNFRALPTLPDRISVDVPGWMMVAWRRLDPRIKLQDIVDRMTTDLGEAQQLTEKTALLPKKNNLQNNCSRSCRKLLNYYNDYGRRHEPHRSEVEAMEGLTMNHIRYNTVLPYNAQYNRLVKVKFTRSEDSANIHIKPLDVTEDNLEETTYPVDHFLFDGYRGDLSDSMSDAMKLLWVVQERAIKHGLNPALWKKLGRSCLPSSWFDRTKEKTELIDTYDGGCEVCTWKSPADDHWKTIAPKKRESRANPKAIRFVENSEEMGQPDMITADNAATVKAPKKDVPKKRPSGKKQLSSTANSSSSATSRKRKATDDDSPPKKRGKRTDQEIEQIREYTGYEYASVLAANAANAAQSQSYGTVNPWEDTVNAAIETTQTPPEGMTAGSGYVESAYSSQRNDISSDDRLFSNPHNVPSSLTADYNSSESLGDHVEASLLELGRHVYNHGSHGDYALPQMPPNEEWDNHFNLQMTSDDQYFLSSSVAEPDHSYLGADLSFAQSDSYPVAYVEPQHLSLTAMGVG